jgi:hypothetical protein
MGKWEERRKLLHRITHQYKHAASIEAIERWNALPEKIRLGKNPPKTYRALRRWLSSEYGITENLKIVPPAAYAVPHHGAQPARLTINWPHTHR